MGSLAPSPAASSPLLFLRLSRKSVEALPLGKTSLSRLLGLRRRRRRSAPTTKRPADRALLRAGLATLAIVVLGSSASLGPGARPPLRRRRVRQWRSERGEPAETVVGLGLSDCSASLSV